MHTVLMLLAIVLGYDLTARPAWQAALPDELAEISGQAFTADGRLFAHGDEQALIYRLDARSGRILDRFAVARTGHDPNMGKKPRGRRHDPRAVAGDFEDIAIVGARFFLVSSNGVLLEFQEGRAGALVPYQAHDTRLAGRCEVEGLAHDGATESLLLLCKDRRGKGKLAQVEVYAWSLETGRLTPSPRFSSASSALARVTSAAEFNGSAIAATPKGSFLLVAGPQQAFAEIDGAGRIVRGGAFPRGIYRQPEGAAFAPDGSLLISSEAAGGQASIAGYLPAKR